MKKLKNITFLVIIASVIFSCENNEIVENDTINSETIDLEPSLYGYGDVPKEVFAKLVKLGVNPIGAEPYTLVTPDEGKESGWLSHDIFLSDDDLKTMDDLPPINDEANQRLYRTFNLVRVPNSGKRTIKVRGRSLPQELRIGLRRAVNNYNQLNLRFRINLSFGSNNGGADIIVFANNSNGAGAVGRFPSGGNPGRTIEIDRGIINEPIRNVEHVITHELGHCFGLRHSDLGTRSSCFQNIDEQSFPDGIRFGAVFIPGTSRDRNSQTSVMKSCYGNESGNFFRQDRVGLRRLY